MQQRTAEHTSSAGRHFDHPSAVTCVQGWRVLGVRTEKLQVVPNPTQRASASLEATHSTSPTTQECAILLLREYLETQLNLGIWACRPLLLLFDVVCLPRCSCLSRLKQLLWSFPGWLAEEISFVVQIIPLKVHHNQISKISNETGLVWDLRCIFLLQSFKLHVNLGLLSESCC